MGCGCGSSKVQPQLRWTVDLSVPAADGKTFPDGTNKKTFTTPGDANLAVAKLGLSGKVRPRPATAND